MAYIPKSIKGKPAKVVEPVEEVKPVEKKKIKKDK